MVTMPTKLQYEGFETREIKSLSEQDIEELRRGGGWGLALPAELNGQPGPAHLLELQEELNLSKEQVEAISSIIDEMRTAAIVAGEHFIASETALSNAFADSGLSEETFRGLLAESAAACCQSAFNCDPYRRPISPPCGTERQLGRSRSWTSSRGRSIPSFLCKLSLVAFCKILRT